MLEIKISISFGRRKMELVRELDGIRGPEEGKYEPVEERLSDRARERVEKAESLREQGYKDEELHQMMMDGII